MMERLTIRDDDGTVRIKREINGNTCFSNYMRSFDIEAVYRLGAYEDTGLTPGEVISMKMDMAIINAMFQNTEVERMKELVEADKDGRLVVLPCKVWDAVFLIDGDAGCVRECEVEFLNIGRSIKTVVVRDPDDWSQYGVTFYSFGKTAFLTREEAEAALKEAKKDA